MANRQKAVKMASRGASAKEVRQTTGVTGQAARNIVSRAASSSSAPSSPAASMQIYQQSNGNPITTQAPARPAHVQQSYVDAGSGKNYNTRFVPGAMLPGQKGYDPNTGGGVWAAGGTDEGIRAWYRSQDPANTAGDQAIEMSGKDASAFTLDGLYGKGVGQAGAQAEAQAKQSMGYKDIKSIRQGLKIGANNIISKKEANRISKNTRKSFDTVLSKALSLGYQAANNAVNKSNKAYGKTMGGMLINSLGSDSLLNKLYAGQDPLTEMRRVRPTKGKVYSGTYMLDGVKTPLVESRNPRANPLGIRQTGTPTETQPVAASSPAPTMQEVQSEPMTAQLPEEQLPEEKTPQFMSGSSADLANWATGFRRKGSSRKGAGPRAQGLGSQRVNPTGSFRGGM